MIPETIKLIRTYWRKFEDTSDGDHSGAEGSALDAPDSSTKLYAGFHPQTSSSSHVQHPMLLCLSKTRVYPDCDKYGY